MSDGAAVVVTGLGALTPVGRGAAQTFTSVRARLNRFRTWPELGVDLPGAEGGGLPTASSMAELGDASWPEKAEALLAPALLEALHEARLFHRSDLLSAYHREAVAGWLAIPAEGRPGVDAEGLDDFTAAAATHCLVDVPSTRVDLVARGHAGGLLAAEAARAALAAGEIDVAVLGGVDSLLETRCLLDLLRRKRVKTEGRPSGAVPGEGAAFVVLEREEQARGRGVPVHARFLAGAAADEPLPYDGTEALTAAALSSVLHALLDGVDPEADRVGDVFVDLNGERGRFAEWALADARCLQPRAFGYALHHPADSTGDLGAAAGVLHLGLAARLLSTGKARGSRALVCGMSEGGDRAGCLLGRAEGSG